MGVYKEGKNWKVQVYYKDWQGNRKRKQKKVLGLSYSRKPPDFVLRSERRKPTEKLEREKKVHKATKDHKATKEKKV